MNRCLACPHEAAVRWTFALSGNVVLLCWHCCASFRRNAELEPDLGASHIAMLPPVVLEEAP